MDGIGDQRQLLQSLARLEKESRVILCKLTDGGAPDSTGNMAIFGLRVEFPLVSNGTL
jgi:hypothetical protein